MKRQRESELKKSIMDWLKIQPKTFAWRNNTTGIPIGVTGKFRTNLSKGIADICGVKNGKAFAFEAKIGKKKLKPHQEDWLKKFDSAGGYACVVRSFGDAAEAFGEI